MGFDLALVGALILLNALFAGSEMALVSLREGQVRGLERESGASARALLVLARDPNRFLATIQIGITLAGFLASAFAAVSLAEPLVPALGVLGGAARPVAIALITLVLTFLTLVFGELAPKRLAMQYALRWALVVARPLRALAVLTRPAVWGLSASTDLVVRALGGDPHADREQLGAEELRELIAGHRGLDPEQRAIITGALQIRERLLREIVVPRRAVFAVRADATVEEARVALAAGGHTRAPVAHDADLDDTIGMVNLRDLITARTLAEAIRPITVFPDSVRVSEALRRFKATRQQFALVAGEHGAMSGMVTLEDLLEEIVGEIYDEDDPDAASSGPRPDGSVLLPGTFPLRDLSALGVEITDRPEGDYHTVAGLFLVATGRIPTEAGERVEFDRWTVEVQALDRRAITTVLLRPRPAGSSPPTPNAPVRGDRGVRSGTGPRRSGPD